MPDIAYIASSIGHGSVTGGVFSGTITGTLTSASGKTTVSGNPIAVLGDTATCNAHGPSPIVTTIVAGSGKATDVARAMARVGDPLACGAIIATGLPKFKVA